MLAIKDRDMLTVLLRAISAVLYLSLEYYKYYPCLISKEEVADGGRNTPAKKNKATKTRKVRLAR